MAVLEKRCFFLKFANLERFSGVVTVGWGVQRWVKPRGTWLGGEIGSETARAVSSGFF